MNRVKPLAFWASAILFLLPEITFAQTICNGGLASDGQICNPTGANTLLIFFSNNFTPALVSILVSAIILMIVYSGFRMIVSQGNTEQVEKAKQSLKWTIGGSVVVILAFVIVAAINDFLGGKDISSEDVTDVQNPIASNTVADLTGKIFSGVATIVGSLAILFIMINAFRYITAQGNEEQTQSAKQGLQWSIFGLVIVLLAYVIISAIFDFFGWGGDVVSHFGPGN